MLAEPSDIAEGQLRRRIRKKGYALRKSRQPVGPHNKGGYRIIDAFHNLVIAGENFDLGQAEVIEWLRELEAEQ